MAIQLWCLHHNPTVWDNYLTDNDDDDNGDDDDVQVLLWPYSCGAYTTTLQCGTNPTTTSLSVS